MSDTNGNTPPKSKKEMMDAIMALRGAGGVKTSAGSSINNAPSRSLHSDTGSGNVPSGYSRAPQDIASQPKQESLIAQKIRELRGEVRHTEEPQISKKLYVSQEDIEQGRDTSILDQFIEDVIAKRI